MIRPPGFAGAVFGTAALGDLRRDDAARERVSADLGVPSEWAYVNQVHGATVQVATHAGLLGDGDAIVVYRSGLPIMVATADCVPVVLEAEDAAAVVHAGWRGAIAGVLPGAVATMRGAGHPPVRAAIGPAIGPCCYEVGSEVAARFPGYVRETTWGTQSVDIPGFLAQQVDDLVDVWQAGECTYTSSRLYSYRRDATKQRQVTVAWLPGS
jgi:YfiH family protein